MMNTMRTFMLMAALTVLFVLIGQAIGGDSGMVMAFILALVINLASYWFSDRIVLSMYHAQEVSRHEAPGLYRMVEHLAGRAGIATPRLYIIPEPSPNAFATGRNPENSAVAVTQGILNSLSDQELEGVLAHEIAHIKNRDMLIGTIAATMAGAITMLANWAQWIFIFGGYGGGSDDDRPNPLVMLLMIIVAPIAAMLIQLAVSRSREYVADETGARLAGTPMGLASALRRLDRAVHGHPPFQLATRPATAHLFIVNPLTGGGIETLFSTHPPIEERIRRLEAMARSSSFGYY